MAHQSKFRLALTLNEPNQSGDTWETVAVAIVSDEEDKSFEGGRVQFCLKGANIDAPVVIDGGRATKAFPDLPEGNHTFEAVLVGYPTVRDRKVLPLKKNRPEPFDLELQPSGRDGDYLYHATIVNENGDGMAGTILVSKSTETGWKSCPAAADGVNIPVKFQERRCEVRFAIQGTARGNKTLFLSGPKRPKPKYKFPVDNPPNIFTAFFRGMRDRDKAEKEARQNNVPTTP